MPTTEREAQARMEAHAAPRGICHFPTNTLKSLFNACLRQNLSKYKQQVENAIGSFEDLSRYWLVPTTSLHSIKFKHVCKTPAHEIDSNHLCRLTLMLRYIEEGNWENPVTSVGKGISMFYFSIKCCLLRGY